MSECTSRYSGPTSSVGASAASNAARVASSSTMIRASPGTSASTSRTACRSSGATTSVVTSACANEYSSMRPVNATLSGTSTVRNHAEREQREVRVGGVRHHGGHVLAGRDAGGGQGAGPRPGPAVQLGVGERGAVDVLERDRGRSGGGPPCHRVRRQAGGVEHRRMLYTTGGPGPQRRAAVDRRRVRVAGGPLRPARPVARARAGGLLARAVGAAGRDGRPGHGRARIFRRRGRGDARPGARGRGPRPPAGTGAAGGAHGRGSGARGHERRRPRRGRRGRRHRHRCPAARASTASPAWCRPARSPRTSSRSTARSWCSSRRSPAR